MPSDDDAALDSVHPGQGPCVWMDLVSVSVRIEAVKMAGHDRCQHLFIGRVTLDLTQHSSVALLLLV